MKILSKGILPEDRSYIFTCLNCYTKFEAEGRECEMLEGYLGRHIVRHNCPLCHKSCQNVF